MKRTNFIFASTFKLTATVAIISSLYACGNSGTTATEKKETENYNEVSFNDSNATKDAQLMIDIAVLNLEEVKLGMLAQKNSETKEIKELGKMMEDAHTKAFNDLTVLAQTKIVTLPTDLNADNRAFYDKMSQSLGKDFDKQYAEVMAEDHKKAVAALEELMNQTRDADVKQFASKAIAILGEHTNHAALAQSKYQ